MICLQGVLCLLLLLASTVVNLKAKQLDPPECHQDDFEQLFTAVKSSYAELEKLTQLAEQKGLDCTYERITMNTTQLFMNFSLFDFNASSALCRAYRERYGEKGCAEGEYVPCRQLSKCVDILNTSTAQISKLLHTPDLQRRKVPEHHMLGTVQRGNYLYRGNNSFQPVFPGGYDHGNYAFYYGFPPDVIPQVETVGQDSEEVVAHIATLLPTPDGVNTSEVQRIIDTFDSLYQSRLVSGLVLMCKLPDWVKSEYPDITRYMQSSCDYDIDHPMVRKLWTQGLTPLIEKLRNHPALHSYRLGNEVFFGILGNNTPISSYTTGKWHTWLSNKYKDIASLNKAWQTSYVDFSEVIFPGKKQNGKFVPDSNVYGTAKWYDFCRFNADRVLDYYSWFTGLVHQFDPGTPTHVKYVNEHFFNSLMDHGLDRLALDKLTNWSGCDTRIMPAPVALIKTQFRNTGQYALDWLNPAIGYTWMMSTSPQKMVIDMEIHPISTTKNRNGSVADNHLSAAIWIAHLHGLSLHLLWAWPRFANGSYRFDIVDTLPTLPQAVNGYAQSLAYINALGPEVVALVTTAPRPVCILWSVVSSMQDQAYLSAQVDTFEALSFFGPQPVFVAEPDIEERGVGDSCLVLVIPGQRFVSDDTVAAVEKYANMNGGKVIVVGNSSVFNYNEAGVQRSTSSLAWLKKLVYIADQEPLKLLRAMEQHLEPAMTARLVTCVDASGNKNETAWGVICRAAKTNDGVVIALVNVLTLPVKLRLYDAGGHEIKSAVDMYMYEDIDLSTPLLIMPLDVRMVLVRSTEFI